MPEEPQEKKAGLKTVLVFLMLFALLGAVVVLAYFATFDRPVTTVIVIRHTEKNIEPNNTDPDLSPAGQARAQELVHIFGDAEINALYATTLKRTQQTMKPLADRLGLPVTTLEPKDIAGLTQRILTTNRGQTVMVAAHNNTVPEIIAALGGPQYPIIPDTEFDHLYVVMIYRTGKAKVVKMKYGSASPVPAANGTMTPNK